MSGVGEGSLFGCPVPEGFFSLPGSLRILLGQDGTLTRSLSLLARSPVSVETVALPGAGADVRKVFLVVPGPVRLVFARTRLEPSPRTSERRAVEGLMRGGEAIGQAMEARFGPLIRDRFSIFSFPGDFDEDCPSTRGFTWARSYRLGTRGGNFLKIEEFFLPPLMRMGEKG